MRKPAIERVEAEHLVQDRPTFYIGDTVDVGVRIREGEKERTQVFTGVVIARRGIGTGETFTVRRIVAGEGVERTFPLHSPSVTFIRTVRSGRVHRAKLHYLRDRVGKATRLAEVRRDVGAARRARAEAEAAAAEAETTDADALDDAQAAGADEAAADDTASAEDAQQSD
jgi:large subunit ribosomal protein L19